MTLRPLLAALGVALLLSSCRLDADTPGPPASGAADASASDASASDASASGVVTVSDAFSPAAPAGGTSALFVTLRGGAAPDTLIGAAFAGAGRVEIHESYDAGDGMRGMRRVPGVAVPAGATVRLAPGGYHVMLMQLTDPLAAGDTLAATLTFARAGTQAVPAVVRSLDAMPGPGHTP